MIDKSVISYIQLHYVISVITCKSGLVTALTNKKMVRTQNNYPKSITSAKCIQGSVCQVLFEQSYGLCPRDALIGIR